MESLAEVYPLAEKSSASMAESLNDFVDDIGIPDTLVCDLAPEYIGPNSEMMKMI